MRPIRRSSGLLPIAVVTAIISGSLALGPSVRDPGPVLAAGGETPLQVPEVEWERIAMGGDAPDRALHGMIYDPQNQAFWSFGGVEADAQSNQFRNDLFRLDAGAPDAKWSRVPIAGLKPPPLAFHTATYDPLRQRLIVYGGLIDRRGNESQQPADGNTLWLLDLSGQGKLAWSRETVHGNPVDRFAHAAVYVPAFDALVVSGGAETFDRSTSSNYALYLGEEPMRWERLANAGFSARAGHALAFDEAASRLLAYGGLHDLSNLKGTREMVALDVSAGLADSRQWARVTTATPGLARGLMAAAYDPVSRLWWVHGGIEANNRFVRDLSVLDLKPARPEWTRTQVVYNGPLERFGHTAALDASRGRIVFQGGTPDNAITLRDTRSLVIAVEPTPTSSASPTITTAPDTPTPTASSTPTETAPTPTTTATGPTATATATDATAAATSPTVTRTPGTATPTRENGATVTPSATPVGQEHEVYLPLAIRGHTM